jgi:hypothetical protein
MIMDRLTTRKRRTPIAATCIAMGGCGEADTLDPNALVREAAEARLDRSPPSPSITSPTSADSLTDTTGVVALAGSASDNRQVARVTWVNDHGANGLALLDGSGKSVTWSTSQISLVDGANTLTVRAYVNAGNATERTLVVTYLAPARVHSASYSTTFSLTENTISEGGKWVNGQAVAASWNNARSVSGKAYAADFATCHCDPITVLNSSFAANQYAPGHGLSCAGLLA